MLGCVLDSYALTLPLTLTLTLTLTPTPTLALTLTLTLFLTLTLRRYCSGGVASSLCLVATVLALGAKGLQLPGRASRARRA